MKVFDGLLASLSDHRQYAIACRERYLVESAFCSARAGVDRGHFLAHGDSLMKPAFKWMMIIGGLLTVGGPVFGMLATVMGMTRSIEILGSGGVGSAEQLSAGIGQSLVSTAVGMVLAFVGVALFFSGLIGCLVERKRLKSQPAGEVPAS